jgi:hypothetical protein
VGDCLVQILPADGADEPAVLDHEDSALGVALADDHRVGDGLSGPADLAARRPLGATVSSCGRKTLAKRLLGLVQRQEIAEAARGGRRRGSAIAAASISGARLRVTANTRPSISTSRTSASVSVRSTILCARFDTPSTYSGQRTAATSIHAGHTLGSDGCYQRASSSCPSVSGVEKPREQSWRAPCRGTTQARRRPAESPSGT